ncbi:bifunctional 3-phenylpropionate/cinnamic acid dioxygenase ferredoxin subunit [Streptomyces longispororuber]|uniref:Bifunctional 3-phenylpropionate/cinnamic acid dioxygenase ferredoxin subunit n=1 Tax=Streptomyces longispororuber TaxID=68230 RepID=A0A919DTV0_9ACTN|nr:bifunctional 3-phenylpropionate/cinnamic acid dioxygenase ferredoxin subunit [Streptomyces longispororuber]GHE77977.1 bifunctional 3-phenylpropionate/cinnamic acid dioxygenase ferredoxin subunit [Streptomyces longispororuber]
MLPVCRLDELPAGESVRVDTTPPIAVFNADGELYAVDDTCSHQDASLSDGWLEGCLIECPLHAATFDLRTGEPTCLPARRPVRTYRVSVVGGMVHVHVAGSPSAPAESGTSTGEGSAA